MSTNPFQAGVFYEGEFVTDSPRFRFDNPLRDQRQVISMEIAAASQFSVLTMRFPLGGYFYLRVSTGGVLLGSFTLPDGDEGQTTILRGSTPPPGYLTFTDENGAFHYLRLVGAIGSPTFDAGTDIPTNWTINDAEFIGEYLDMLGQDGHTMYRITVDSSDVIHVDVLEDQPWRLQSITIQNGHPFLHFNNRTYLATLMEMGTVEASLSEQTAGYGGVVIPRIGIIRIGLHDPEALDFMASQPWDGRDIIVRIGSTDENPALWPVALRGKSQSAEWNEDEFSLTLRDPGIQLRNPVQTEHYTGAGGIDGNPDLTGRVKPVIYGTVFHVTPVLLDETLNLYQLSTRPLTSVDRVADGGLDLTVKGDLGNNLLTWQPNATEVNLAHVYFDFQRGLMRTASPPERRLTCSANNFVTSDLGRNYTVADIVMAIAEDRMPELNIDISSFTEHSLDIPYRSGIYIDDERSIEDVFNELTKDLNTCVGIDRLGNLFIRKLRRRVPRAFITDNEIIEQTLKRQNPPTPGIIYKLGHRRSYTKFTETDFLGASTDFLRSFLAEDYRYAVRDLTDTSYTKFTSAETKILHSLFNDANSAEELILQIIHNDFQLRDVYSFTVEDMSYLFNVADTVQIQYPRFDLNVPRIGIVVGVSELSPTADEENRTALTVWC